MRIGLLFGTFDPIHVGHIKVAINVHKADVVDNIWFIITPQSPFKKNQKTSSKEHRFEMTNIAIENYSNFFASNIEFHLPKPNYTSATLRYIQNQYPHDDFYIIMGADNYDHINKWKDSQYILNNFDICVYKRSGYIADVDKNIINISGNYIDVSSSEIRNQISSTDVNKLLDPKVLAYINQHTIYN